MKVVEFKEILESIENGLYEKWEANYKTGEKNQNIPIDDFIKDNVSTDLTDAAFYWSNTPEHYDFWNDVDEKYTQILKEKDYTLEYWKDNAKEDYSNTPISVLEYISQLELKVHNLKQPK